MLILLEGTDGGGKSTLADQLIDAHRRRYADRREVHGIKIHSGKPVPGVDPFDEYEVALDNDAIGGAIRSPHDLVVMDRWHAGEIPYGRIYRGKSRLTDGGMLHVEMSLTAVGALKVLVQPEDVDVIRRRLKMRGEDFLQPQHINEVHAWYEYHCSRYNYMRADRCTPDFLLDLASLKANDGVSTSTTRYSITKRLPGYVGAKFPQVLLVGDQRNGGPQARPGIIRAFTPCGSGNSSEYLMNAMLIAGMHHDVGLVNAHEPGVDLSLITELVDQSTTVVALGSNASRTLTGASIKHETVPHPQWWRRFRHSKIDSYADAIKEAARWR